MTSARPVLLLLVVLYKKQIFDSETLCSLVGVDRSIFDFKILVWDNSPQAQEPDKINSAKEAIPGLIYYSCPENLGLARVYNSVVRRKDFDFLMLLDQDSILPSDFFISLASSVSLNSSVDLFLPIVRSGSKIVSPGSLFFFKGKHWRAPRYGAISSRNVLAISSGMVISLKYLLRKKSPFDERLSLYGIDTRFMIEFASSNSSLFVLSSELTHNTLLWSSPPADVMLGRFRNLRSSWPIVFEGSFFVRHLASLYAIYVSIKLALRYKDFRFLGR